MLAMAGTLNEIRGTPGNKLLMIELLIGTAEAMLDGTANGKLEASVGTAEAGRMLPPLTMTRLPLGMRLDGRPGDGSVIVNTAVAPAARDDAAPVTEAMLWP